MLSTHNILSARYAEPEPVDGYAANAAVIAIHAVYGAQQRHANDDNDGGGMLAYLAEGGTIDPHQPRVVTANDVQAERERRLSAGFDYDFGDGRGVHRIGTTPADMQGWDEVTKVANAALMLSQAITIDVVTDTGPVAVTPTEWQQILLAATTFRQPIWHGSFALQAMDPIPADYKTNDAYWTD